MWSIENLVFEGSTSAVFPSVFFSCGGFFVGAIMLDSSFDDVLEFSLEYEIEDTVFDVTVRIVSKAETGDDLVQEVCDVMTVSESVSPDGATYNHETWRLLLNEHGIEQEFWEQAVEKFVLIQICLKTLEPGNA